MTSTPEPRPLRVLFLCTQNSARSQVAEALLKRKGRGRFEAGSAGTEPASRVHPMAVEALRAAGIDWSAARPKSIEDVMGESWDFVITVCDNAREACPTIPGQPLFAHWGTPDPAAVEGDDEHRLTAFKDTLIYLGRRIDLLVALPFESLEKRAAEERVRAMGKVS